VALRATNNLLGVPAEDPKEGKNQDKLSLRAQEEGEKSTPRVLQPRCTSNKVGEGPKKKARTPRGKVGDWGKGEDGFGHGSSKWKSGLTNELEGVGMKADSRGNQRN